MDSKCQILKLARTYFLRSKIYVIILLLPWTWFILWGMFGTRDVSVSSDATLGDCFMNFMIFYFDISSIDNDIFTMNWPLISNFYGTVKYICFDIS
jgi:hypothetical protein